LPSRSAETLRIERVPETGEARAWEDFSKRLSNLANQGYRITHTTNAYILLRRTCAATRREE
jgi:hypothetical protein